MTTPTTTQSTVTAREYLLGSGADELRRLILQHQVYAPITRNLFEAAGIGRGMRVLDVGSGAGDVAFLLADLVGPSGQVLGIDQNAEVLNTARARAQALGLANVSFQAADIRTVQDLPELDAIVGRWILMHLDNPATLLRRLLGFLRPGGVSVFQESDFTYQPRMFPETPLASQMYTLIAPRPIPGGPDMEMGTRLHQVFVAAGLPSPQLRVEAPMGGGADWPGYELLAASVRSFLPLIERHTGAAPAEIEIDTLAERLREESLANHAVQMLALVVGAWARKGA